MKKVKIIWIPRWN